MTANTLTAPLPADVERVDSIDDTQFERLITSNLAPSPESRAVWVALCHPAVSDRTAGCLDEMAEVLERKIAGRHLPATHGHVKWLNMIRTRIQQVEGARVRHDRDHARWVEHQRSEGRVADETRDLLRRLALAVNAHRLACVAADLAPEAHDLDLWAALDDLRTPSFDPERADGGPSLAELITSRIWYPGNVTP
jgi:hypothetical protein